MIPQEQGFPGGSVVKNPPAIIRDTGSVPGSGKSPGEENGRKKKKRKWQPSPVFSSGKSHGQKSLASYIQSMGWQKSRTQLSDRACTQNSRIPVTVNWEFNRIIW